MSYVVYGISPIAYEQLLDRDYLQKYVYSDTRHNYYYSEDFSAEFYIAQAKAGFVAVSDTFGDKEVLLPEIQFSYAVLHFENLHISKKVKKLLRNDKIRLRLTEEILPLTEAIRAYHTRAWLTPRYVDTLLQTKEKKENFRTIGVYVEENGRIIAGEVGYCIGKTYTSLSGFSSKEKTYRNYGTLQMVLLAQYLRRHGFAFWNLGHPYMSYKFALGATLYSRRDFLDLWYRYTNETIPLCDT